LDLGQVLEEVLNTGTDEWDKHTHTHTQRERYEGRTSAGSGRR
jgi:hypothetical protein